MVTTSAEMRFGFSAEVIRPVHPTASATHTTATGPLFNRKKRINAFTRK